MYARTHTLTGTPVDTPASFPRTPGLLTTNLQSLFIPINQLIIIINHQFRLGFLSVCDASPAGSAVNHFPRNLYGSLSNQQAIPAIPGPIQQIVVVRAAPDRPTREGLSRPFTAVVSPLTGCVSGQSFQSQSCDKSSSQAQRTKSNRQFGNTTAGPSSPSSAAASSSSLPKQIILFDLIS